MAFVIDELPIPATPCVNWSEMEFAAGLLQEQEPLMQDVDANAGPPPGHKQSEASLHDLGLLIKSLSRKRTRYEMFEELRCWLFHRWSSWCPWASTSHLVIPISSRMKNTPKVTETYHYLVFPTPLCKGMSKDNDREWEESKKNFVEQHDEL